MGRTAFSLELETNRKKYLKEDNRSIDASTVNSIHSIKEPFELPLNSILCDIKVEKHETENETVTSGKIEHSQQLSDVIKKLGIEGGLISSDSQLDRIMRFFFQHFPRATHKIGLVYVGEDQRNQNILLANSIASHEFFSFINGIGYNVDMMKHLGFSGGLSTQKEGTGPTSIYFADALNEVMYHVSPLITSNLNDKQNIYKKRHIGNDNVHIIYSEDSEEYDNEMIVSQFNHAHIIVYPLASKKRVIVDVRSKKDVALFGLLRGRSIVSMELAPSLARITSISANNAARKLTSYSKFNKSGDISFTSITEKSKPPETLYVDLIEREKMK
jgi:hypothetical protein